jgi:diguanylate cyclase (GGDEF)-like protein
MLLALGAPTGLSVVRTFAGDRATYVYVTLSTAIVFAAFGYVLGMQADRLLALSRIDPLTGLLNRRAFEGRARGEVARAARHGHPLSVLLVDVDGLKQVNDRAGHGAGDAALRRVAGAIREGIREFDAAGRWGGDEFVILAPHAGRDAAVALAERVRALAAVTETVSTGIATLEAGETMEALIGRADVALYEAKRSGRNRVASARMREIR